jgi:hypothetical protein
MFDLLVTSVFVAMVVSPAILVFVPKPANLKHQPIFSRRSSREPML